MVVLETLSWELVLETLSWKAAVGWAAHYTWGEHAQSIMHRTTEAR